MKVKSAKALVLVLTPAGILFVAAIFIWLILPSLSELRDQAKAIVSAQTELEAQYANRKRLLENIQEVGKVKQTIAKLSSQFIPEKRELDFITQNEEIASRRGVESRIRLSAATAGGLPEMRRTFEIVLTGEYRPTLLAFLDLVRLPTLISIDAVTVNASRSDAPEGPSPVSIVIRGAIALPPAGL